MFENLFFPEKFPRIVIDFETLFLSHCECACVRAYNMRNKGIIKRFTLLHVSTSHNLKLGKIFRLKFVYVRAPESNQSTKPFFSTTFYSTLVSVNDLLTNTQQ